MCAGIDKTELLQTAQATIYNPSRPQRVRAILDNGSQRSYKADQVKNVLSLKSEGAQPLSIATFGSDRKDLKLFNVVHVATKVNHGPGLELIVFSVPHIYKPLTAQPSSLCAATWDHYLTLRRLEKDCFIDWRRIQQICKSTTLSFMIRLTRK